MLLRKLFVLLILLFAFFAAAAEEVKNAEVVVECRVSGESPTEISTCCSGLQLVNNICQDPSVTDPALKSCTNHSECDPGLGCYEKDLESLFSQNASSEEEMARLIEGQNKIDEILGEREPKREGESCSNNADCESYVCSGRTTRTCAPKEKACRLAAEDEAAPGNIECEPGLQKDASGVCKLRTDLETYSGLIQDKKIKEIPGKACQFQMSDELKIKSVVAMHSMRAMEWLLANMNNEDDCMRIIPFLRTQLKEEFFKSRQAILENFNNKMAEIDADMKTLSAAQAKKEAAVSIHGETISEKDLASRRTSGSDMLILMMRKNLLIQSYEVAMNDLAQKTFAKISRLSADVKTWTSHHSKKWYLNGEEIESKDYRCRGGGFLGWGRRKIYKRWAKKIWIKPSSENMSTISDPKIASNLTMITGHSRDKILDELASQHNGYFGIGAKKRYLIDPFISTEHPSSVSVYKFLGFLPIGTKSFSNFKVMREEFRKSVKDYYKKLKTNSERKDFIYEPELLGLEVRDCIDKPDSPGCEKFEEFLNQLTDVAFSQYVAWAYHYRGNYKNFFNNEGAWRRKLLNHWEIQLSNLSTYYTEITKLRNSQNNCLEKVLKKVDSDNLNVDLAGLNEGKNNYYDETNYTDKVKKASHKAKTSIDRKNFRNKYLFNLNPVNLSLQKGGIIEKVNAAGELGSAGTLGDPSITAAMSKRVAEMKAMNDKAAKMNGSNLAEKEKLVLDSMGYLASNSYTGGGSLSGSGPLSSSAGRNKLSPPSLANEKSSSTDEIGKGKETNGLNPSQQGLSAGDKNINGQGYISEGSSKYESGHASISSAGGEYTDPTGMSDEEKAVVMANYERNKSKYNTDEEDSIFKVISKAYVRSLDKVLTKKKRID